MASVHGMAPIDALPEGLPAPARSAVPQGATQTCLSCGKVNPVENRFCEGCGRALQAAPTHPEAAPPPQSSWLYDAEPASSPAPTEAAPAEATISAAPTPATPTTVAPAAHDENFFYFYDDSSAQRGNRRLLIILLVVLALGIAGVIYLMSRPSAKSAAIADVTVTISPTEAKVVAGEAHDFAATVTGSGDSDVTWSVEEGSAGGKVVNHGAQAQGGTVSTVGVYIAPSTPGTYHVVATSKADPAKSVAAEVTVTEK